MAWDYKKVVGPQMQRQAVGVMRSEAAVSERRACGLVKLHRATCRYRRRRVEDPRLRERLRELAATRRRFGYRRLKILLKREGFAVNHKRVYRLYVEEKLVLRRKRGCRRDRKKPALLKTIRGVGYRLDAATVWRSTADEACDCPACRTKPGAARLSAANAGRRRPTA